MLAITALAQKWERTPKDLIHSREGDRRTSGHHENHSNSRLFHELLVILWVENITVISISYNTHIFHFMAPEWLGTS